MSDHKDYNIMSEYGVKDQDYVEEFGMPQNLVGTPGVNEYMITHTYNQNIADNTERLISEGMEERKARSTATTQANKAKDAAYRNLANLKKTRGY